jgi:hypothetical protein
MVPADAVAKNCRLVKLLRLMTDLLQFAKARDFALNPVLLTMDYIRLPNSPPHRATPNCRSNRHASRITVVAGITG